MEFETIQYETGGGVARITLNRPEKLNALSFTLQKELNAALWEADNDTAVHCMILRGNGRAFSAGYDLTPLQSPKPKRKSDEQYTNVYRGMASLEDDLWQLERQQRERIALWDVHKPVIAQVHGYCLAGGTDLALLCDIVIAADDAVFGFPPVRAMGSPVGHMWTYLVGPQWAKYFLLTGDSVSGAQAAEIGLVFKSVPPDALEAEVEALAAKMAKIEVELLAPNKRIVNIALEMMGARTVQRMAAEMDARAHQAPAVREFGRRAMTEGLKAALEWRDSKFGDGRAADDYQRRRAEQEARLRHEE
jgi:enoyl-CoA hydratase